MAEKLYYSIGEVSEMLGVTIPTLRYWENEVSQLQPRTTAGKTRMYTEGDITLLRRIIFLRSQHVPVKDLSKRLAAESHTLDSRARLTELLESVKTDLVNLKNII